jgi:hypothetical protein
MFALLSKPLHRSCRSFGGACLMVLLLSLSQCAGRPGAFPAAADPVHA